MLPEFIFPKMKLVAIKVLLLLHSELLKMLKKLLLQDSLNMNFLSFLVNMLLWVQNKKNVKNKEINKVIVAIVVIEEIEEIAEIVEVGVAEAATVEDSEEVNSEKEEMAREEKGVKEEKVVDLLKEELNEFIKNLFI